MFIDKNSLQVKYGNNAYVNLGQYIVEAQYNFNKLWADDSGRNLAGNMSGTLIGIFPKIIVHFRKLTKTEMEAIIPILDSRTQTLKYYDPYKKTTVEMQTYTGDYNYSNKKIINGNSKNEGFEISFIALSKRT